MKIYSSALSGKLGTRKWITVAGYSLSALSKPFLYIADVWRSVPVALISIYPLRLAETLLACSSPATAFANKLGVFCYSL